MRILYVALRESIPGTHGGAVHVLEVARQLTRRGHEMTVVVRQEAGRADRETLDGFQVIRLPVGSKYLLFRKRPLLAQFVQEIKPDVLMERYYNFAGAGIMAAQALGVPSMLEVNAPLLDPPGTPKAIADTFLLGWMRRRAFQQASSANRIVTPLAATVPTSVPREKIREIPWGANVEVFDRARLDTTRIQELATQINPERRRVVLFLGSFRPWHGVTDFLNVAREIVRHRQDVLFLMVGSGELLGKARQTVERNGLQEYIALTGAVPYDQVPYYLAVADVGVAPFKTSLHAPLQVGFYWSPLKIHEYMAMALPVITIDVHPLNQIVRQGQEGLLYHEGDLPAIRAHIECLVDDNAVARRLGEAGRKRVVEKFSWQKHAEQLEQVLQECLDQALTK